MLYKWWQLQQEIYFLIRGIKCTEQRAGPSPAHAAQAEQRTAAAGPGSGSDDGDLNKLSTEKLVR